MEARFLTLTDVAETLNVTLAQSKALVRSGELPAIKIGGRGAWRVERSALEDFIDRMYSETKDFIARDQNQRAETGSETP
ncbi:MAG: helix-turn-helix domain-containing protein [Ornithinimicrobium sp.]